MSGTNSVEDEKPAADTLEDAPTGMEQAETGDGSLIEQLDQTERADPAGAQAPEDRGVAR